MLEIKVRELNSIIAREAERLGLIRVSGPGPAALPWDLFPDLGWVNHQLRGVIFFAVAEAPERQLTLPGPTYIRMLR